MSEEEEKTMENEAESDAENEAQEEVVDGIKLAFPEASVVRIMKRHLDKEKMIKKEVKIAMNQWLEKMCTNVSKEMNRVPYVMMNLHEFKEGTRVYELLEDFDKEKDRILAHLTAIKKDIERLERDLGKVEEAAGQAN